jgi:alpha-beta hydrolase superfamily lysophospholipase
VLTPAYPGFEVEVEALNADPTPIENLTVPAVIDHLTEVIGGMERPPMLMGHSAGGVFTQLMLDRGYGAVGVAINSAPTEGVPVVPLSQLKSTFPVLRTVGRKKAAGFTLEQWRYVFTNTFTEEESRALYERGRLGAVPRCAAAALPARRNRRPRAARPDAGRARMSLPPRPAAPRVPLPPARPPPPPHRRGCWRNSPPPADHRPHPPPRQ